METVREFAAVAPWRRGAASGTASTWSGPMTPCGSRTLVDGDSRHVDVAAGLPFTIAGIPMMTYGDEIGMRGEYGEDGRRPMTWNTELSDDPVRSDDAVQSSDDEEQSEGRGWDARILEVYRGLISARNLSHALRHGGLRWVHADDVLVFLRESTEQTALVHCARRARPNPGGHPAPDGRGRRARGIRPGSDPCWRRCVPHGGPA
jgi:alpha-glucosidase